MYALRVFFIGGLTSYRALFNWISPWILIPMFVVAPVFQILFFAYIGRDLGVASPSFFLVGDAIQYSAVPCLAAMAFIIADERQQQTLWLLLVTPARRVPLFLGRTLPVVVNGFAVSLLALLVGGLLLSVGYPAGALPRLLPVIAATSFSCTGLGLVTAAIGLRVRETEAVVSMLFGVLLVFSGANVPLSTLPRWMSIISGYLPLTHGIAAARSILGGAGLKAVGVRIAQEVAIGAGYLAIGMLALIWLELESRRRATLERF